MHAKDTQAVIGAPIANPAHVQVSGMQIRLACSPSLVTASIAAAGRVRRSSRDLSDELNEFARDCDGLRAAASDCIRRESKESKEFEEADVVQEVLDLSKVEPVSAPLNQQPNARILILF
eukprot:scaffold1438_cov126-Isochrysis_galbana.AAC.2